VSTSDDVTRQMRNHAYATAGVDIVAGDQAVRLMQSAVLATHDERVMGGFGGFSGLFDVSELLTYRRPVLSMSTDGVGTKVDIAQRMDLHDGVGFDMVGMVVDDIAVCGAKPLALTDYIACGKVVPERIAVIVGGVARACAEARTILIGGETAEHPGHFEVDQYDLSGCAIGVVEADEILGAHLIKPDDVVIGMASSGLHSNGFSLVRQAIKNAGWRLDREIPEFGRTLGEEILEPTRIYSPMCLDLRTEIGADLHAYAHVTGGGLAANLARVLPRGLRACVDRSAWDVPAVFHVIGQIANADWFDLEDTFNMGLGMVAVVAPAAADQTLVALAELGCQSWVVGSVKTDNSTAPSDARVVAGTKGVDGGSVELRGNYRH
jgi:phosphoribosylformylglycinamidine cyclo-ligase